jgi:hypothetical protein
VVRYLPRFHPLAVVDKGWFVADHLKLTNSISTPITDEPCDSYEEAQEIADMLNEEEDDPRYGR